MSTESTVITRGKTVSEMPIAGDARGVEIYCVKGDGDYRVIPGEEGGLATLGEGRRVPDDQLPPDLVAAPQRLSLVEALLAVVQAGQLGGRLGYATRGDLYADLAHGQGTLAEVTNDSTSARNGVYRKVGASGGGSWEKAAALVIPVGSVGANEIADGSIGGPKIAASAVTASKLAAAFNYRGVLSAGTANDVVVAGNYLVTGGLSDLPPGVSSGYLSVTAYNSNSYVVQEFISLNSPGSAWKRVIRPNNGPTYGSWIPQGLGPGAVTSTSLADYSVNSAKLGQSYSYRSPLSSGSADDVRVAGRYLITGAMAGMPAGAPVSGYLDVHVHGNWVTQEFSSLYAPDVAWRRTLRTDTAIFYPWGMTKSTGLGALNGKTVAFFGDSITENGDYPERLAVRLGCQVRKFGFGGCRMGLHNETSAGLLYGKMSMWKLADYVSSGNYSELIAAADALFATEGDDNRSQAALLAATNWTTVDYVVIGFGTNDWSGSTILGVATDTSPTTFCGAVNYVIDRLLTAYPHLKICFTSPLWRSRKSAGDGLESDSNPNDNGVYLYEYVDAVVDLARRNKLPAVDLYRSSGINKYTGSLYLADGLHPVAGSGFQLLADKVSAFLSSQY